jgi:hypothetical protein
MLNYINKMYLDYSSTSTPHDNIYTNLEEFQPDEDFYYCKSVEKGAGKMLENIGNTSFQQLSDEANISTLHKEIEEDNMPALTLDKDPQSPTFEINLPIQHHPKITREMKKLAGSFNPEALIITQATKQEHENLSTTSPMTNETQIQLLKHLILLQITTIMKQQRM